MDLLPFLQDYSVYNPLPVPQKKTKTSLISFYQYSDEPEVYVVIFVQPGSVDLQSMTGEKQDHVIGERH